MSTPDTTGWNDSARDASVSHLPNHLRRAIEITPAASTRERIIDIIVADLNQPHDPGTIRPTRLEDWADSRLMRISYDTCRRTDHGYDFGTVTS